MTLIVRRFSSMAIDATWSGRRPTLSSQSDCFVSAAPPRLLAGRLRERQRRAFAHVAGALQVAEHLHHRASCRSRTSLFDSDGQRRAISSGIGRPSDAMQLLLGVRRHLLEERERGVAVELELEERAHDRLRCRAA